MFYFRCKSIAVMLQQNCEGIKKKLQSCSLVTNNRIVASLQQKRNFLSLPFAFASDDSAYIICESGIITDYESSLNRGHSALGVRQEMLSADGPHLGAAWTALGRRMDRAWETHGPRMRSMGRESKQRLMMWHSAVIVLSAKGIKYALSCPEPVYIIRCVCDMRVKRCRVEFCGSVFLRCQDVALASSGGGSCIVRRWLLFH